MSAEIVTMRQVEANVHGKYEQRKETGMAVWVKEYGWLKLSALYGWHCSVCIIESASTRVSCAT